MNDNIEMSDSMKRVVTIILMSVLMSLTVNAQSRLYVLELFGRYRALPDVVEVYVTGKEARTVNLETYRSLSMPASIDEAKKVEQMVVKDGVTAKEKEVEYRGGQLYYGFYMLKPVMKNDKKWNRYLFYLNQSLAKKNPTDRITMIYMEGGADVDYIKSLIKK